MVDKLQTMHDAIAEHVVDGSVVAIEGFTAGICFAAAHEIIRQRRTDLTLVRMTPDLVYDQMVAAGCARRIVFSYLGNPGVGSLHCIRRAIEVGIPSPLEWEEYTHFGMIGRYLAGASGLPFYPLRSFSGSDLPEANPDIRFIEDPYGGQSIAVVPPLHLDVAVIHAQRADLGGNVQAWGFTGMQKEAALAAKRVIAVVEEIVEESVVRSDPNRTLIPGAVVDVLVHEPKGTHPSYLQGYWDRDNQFYREWDRISREHAEVERWLGTFVHDVPDREAYARTIGPETWSRLAPAPRWAAPVNYGDYS